MASTGLQRTTAITKYLLMAAAAFYIIVFFYIALSRINYPFELEWTEGACVTHIEQILSGGKLFAAPTMQFIPYSYTPLYFYVSAGMGAITGVGYLPLRLVSLLSTLGCFVLIFLMVRRSTENSFAAFLSCGLFAASYRFVGAWYDIGRPDMLLLVLLLATAYVLRFKSTPTWHIIAGVLAALAFLTKLHAPLILAPVFLYSLIQNRRLGFIAIGSAIGTAVLATLLLNYHYDGWYNYYIFDLPQQYAAGYLVKERIPQFWTGDLIPHLQIAFVFVLFYFVAKAAERSRDKDFLFYLLFTGGMMAGSWIARIPEAAYTNALIPAYAATAIVFGVAIASISRQVQASTVLTLQPYILVFLYLLTIAQLFDLRYKIGKQIPTVADRRAGEALLKQLAAVDGDVYLPWHSNLAHEAGKQNYASQFGVFNVLVARNDPMRTKLLTEMRTLLRQQHFKQIIIDDTLLFADVQQEFQRYYMPAGSVFSDPKVFRPVTGANWRPEFIYVPRPDTLIGSMR